MKFKVTIEREKTYLKPGSPEEARYWLAVAALVELLTKRKGKEKKGAK